MSSPHDLKDKVRQSAGGADPLGVEDALRKLGQSRERLGEAAADAVEALRDDADVAMHQARRRGHRMRRDARRKARDAKQHWLPTIAAALGAAAAVTALAVGLVKGRRSIRSAADAGTDKVKKAARQVSHNETVESVGKK